MSLGKQAVQDRVFTAFEYLKAPANIEAATTALAECLSAPDDAAFTLATCIGHTTGMLAAHGVRVPEGAFLGLAVGGDEGAGHASPEFAAMRLVVVTMNEDIALVTDLMLAIIDRGQEWTVAVVVASIRNFVALHEQVCPGRHV